MPDLARQRYVSLTSFRSDGTPVATPVWIVGSGDSLFVWTGAQTGKVKRIRRNPNVTLGPCTARGRVTGPVVAARAQIVPAADRPLIWPVFLDKYGLQLRAIMWSNAVSKLWQRDAPADGGRVYLELTLSGGPV
jgi:uncharacterized protein